MRITLVAALLAGCTTPISAIPPSPLPTFLDEVRNFGTTKSITVSDTSATLSVQFNGNRTVRWSQEDASLGNFSSIVSNTTVWTPVHRGKFTAILTAEITDSGIKDSVHFTIKGDNRLIIETSP